MAQLGAKTFDEREFPNASQLPHVSVILATRESDDAIVRRVEDIERSTYPLALLEIIVVLDSTRTTALGVLTARLPSGTRVLSADSPGKAAALNLGVHSSTHDLLLFVDTAQSFAPDAIEAMIVDLERLDAGAMTATLAPTSGDVFMDRYWRRELAIRQGQSSRHSVICVTGCAYVMRRKFWKSMPTGLICDDLWSTYSVITQGGRVGICARANVTDPRRFTRDEEYARRVRTITGMLQFIRWFPDVLRRDRNPMWSDFLLHKLMRPATPVLLGIGLASIWSAMLLVSPRAALALFVAGVLTIVMPWILTALPLGATSRRAQSLVFAQRLILMPLTAIRRAVTSNWDVWKPHR